MDVPLLTEYLTSVTKYYGVEARKSAIDLDVMEKKLAEFKNGTLQVRFVPQSQAYFRHTY